MKLWTTRALVVLLLLAAGPALAQVEVRITPVPPTERGIVAPGLGRETRPSDLDHYPRSGGVSHDPAFVAPMSRKWSTPTQSGRVGIAGWTSPNTPVGGTVGGWREVSGWFALGFSFTWDGPPEAPRPTVR